MDKMIQRDQVDAAFVLAKPLRTKPCKAIPPEESIMRIKRILSENRISTVEIDTSRSESGFYSFMLLVVEGERTLFFVNGKGMNREYALASAYGELMERLQNLSFYMSAVYCSEPEIGRAAREYNKFKYYPDECVLSSKQLADKSFAELRKLLKVEQFSNRQLKQYISKTLGLDSVLCVTFRSLLNYEHRWLPVVLLELITNTNGACSGNTHTEALIHGICEIMERYVLVTAYTKPFTPPTIPPELFLGTEIYDRISGLVKQGLTVEIRDCSLGMRLPVIGVLIIDESKKRYLFHLGADPSPITALERCFTEIYQGGAPEFMPISDALPPNCDKKVITANFDEATRSNTGQWPDSLFLSKSSYSFLGFDFLISSSDKLDLKFLKEVLQENGFDVLARNVSFLGQPAFKVYIPGMSEITNVFDNRYLEALLKFEEHLNSMYKFRELESVADCEKLAIAIEDVIESSLSGRFNAPRPRYFNHLSYHSNRLDRKFTSDVILYFLNNKMEKKSVAKAHLHRIADSLGMRPEDREAFAHISDDLIVKSALGNMKFPSCFSCGNCGSEDVCSFSQIKRLWDVLRQKSSEFDFCLSDSLIADEKTGE